MTRLCADENCRVPEAVQHNNDCKVLKSRLFGTERKPYGHYVQTVLDKGYVRLVDKMGDDLSVVNAARASFAKESEYFGDADDRLIKYLISKQEYSPFRHAVMTFEVYAPLMVARQ